MITIKEIEKKLEDNIYKELTNSDFFNKKRQGDILTRILDSPERYHQPFELQLSNVLFTSMNSSTGFSFEKVIIKTSSDLGYVDLTLSEIFTDTETNNGRQLVLNTSTKQMKLIEERIDELFSKRDAYKRQAKIDQKLDKVSKKQKTVENNEAKNKMINDCKNDIMKICLDESYENDTCKENYPCCFDFCMLSPDWLGPKHILIQELKYGGNLDIKKVPGERRSLLLQFAFMHLLHAKSIRSGDLFVDCRFGIINENKARSASVKNYFTDDELKFGSAFWESMYGYDLFQFQKQITSKFRKEEDKSEKAINFKNEIKYKVKAKFNELGIVFKSSEDDLLEANEKLNYYKYHYSVNQDIVVKQNDVINVKDKIINMYDSILTPEQRVILEQMM